MCELLKSESTFKNLKFTILECAVCVLENTNFQHYFKQQLEQFFELISVILNVVINGEDADFCVRILQTICVFNKQVLQKEVFSILFIQKTLQLAVKVLGALTIQHVADSTASRIKFEVFKCVQQVLFPKTRCKEMSLVFMSLFASKCGSRSGTLEALFECLSSAVVSNQSDSIVHLFSVVFQGFVSSFKGDAVAVHRMFITLCCFVGFKPKVKLSLCDEYKSLLKYKNFKKSFPECRIQKVLEINDTSMLVARNLLDVLLDTNVVLNGDSDEVPFQEWLQALISTAFSSTSKDSISIALLEVMRAFIRLKPLIIEPKISEILELVLLAKKETEEIKVAYAAFFCDVLKMFVKLSRLQKFVAKLLNIKIMLSLKKAEKLPAMRDVLPVEFCTEFQIAVTVLSGGQTVELMRTLLFHLNQDCVVVLEKQQGK